MMRFKLGLNIELVSSARNTLDSIAVDLVAKSEAEGWTPKLIAAARESNPGNPDLFAVAQQLGLAVAGPEGRSLEKLIVQTNSFLDITKWRTRLAELEATVCRIEVRQDFVTSYGTGFLIAPGLVMTNFHVLEQIIKLPSRRGDVCFRFDYKRSSDGNQIWPGKAFSLTKENWLVDFSPPSRVDLEAGLAEEIPSDEELDYVLVKLEGNPGLDRLGSDPDPQGSARGWIRFTAVNYDFPSNSPLFIIQHPESSPLQLTFDTNSIVAVNANGTRVRYRTNTLPGSSGAPCFNQDLELVALHHSGDSRVAPQFNEGIPLRKIFALLKIRGREAEISRGRGED
jgi:hypothetical protein